MTELDVRDVLLNRFGLRVQPEMEQYIARRLRGGGTKSIPVIGGNARTGIAVRQILPASELLDAISADDASIAT